MPVDREASDLAAIVDRIASNTFPIVQPSEQTGEAESHAAETLSWFKKCEAVELQSYIDEMWRLYRQSAIFDDEKPEAVRRAIWAREQYYVHMRQFFEKRNAGRDVVLESLEPFFVCSTQVPSELKEMTSKLDGSAVEHIVQHVNDAWAAFFQGLPPFAQLGDATDMKHVWFLNNYAAILRAFEWPPKAAFVFVPELDLSDISCECGARDAAAVVYKSVQERHTASISEAVEAAFLQECNSIPSYMRVGLGGNLRQYFLAKRYVEIVRDIVAKTPEASTFVFHPLISVESIADEASRTDVAALLGRVEAPHASRIDDMVAERYGQAVATIDEGLRQAMADTLWKNWLAQHYFDTVREVVGAAPPRAPQNSEQDGRSRRRSAPLSTDAFVVPKRRAKAKATPSNALESGPALVSVADCHSRDATGTDSLMVRAAVVYVPDELRWVDVTDRKTKAQQKVAVMSLVLADASAPIALELWRDRAETVFQALNSWQLDAGEDIVWVEVRYAWVRSEQGRCVPAMRRLMGNDRTTVTRASPIASPSPEANGSSQTRTSVALVDH